MSDIQLKKKKEELKSRRQNIVDGIKKGAKIGAGTLGTFGVANGLIEGKAAK